MTNPYTDVSASPNLDKLERLIDDLEADTSLIDYAERKSVAKADYERAKAAKWYEAKNNPELKTIADKEAFIAENLAEEYKEMILSESLYDAKKENIRTLRAIINALQTLVSNARL